MPNPEHERIASPLCVTPAQNKQTLFAKLCEKLKKEDTEYCQRPNPHFRPK